MTTEALDARGEPLTEEQRRFLADMTRISAGQRAEAERRLFDPLPAVDSDPTPAHGTERPAEAERPPAAHTAPDPIAWQACGLCRGAGQLVVSDLTRQLRDQGQPFTVFGPCPRCGGGGGS